MYRDESQWSYLGGLLEFCEETRHSYNELQVIFHESIYQQPYAHQQTGLHYLLLCFSVSYILEDDVLIIECQLTGHPPPTVSWLKDDCRVHESSRVHQTLSEDGICESSTSCRIWEISLCFTGHIQPSGSMSDMETLLTRLQAMDLATDNE